MAQQNNRGNITCLVETLDMRLLLQQRFDFIYNLLLLAQTIAYSVNDTKFCFIFDFFILRKLYQWSFRQVQWRVTCCWNSRDGTISLRVQTVFATGSLLCVNSRKCIRLRKALQQVTATAPNRRNEGIIFFQWALHLRIEIRAHSYSEF